MPGTSKTIAQLNTEIATNLLDNSTGLITPAALRQVVYDMVASYINLQDLTATVSLTITRAQIPSVTMLVTTFMVSGYTTAGDLGAGAIYTSQGATGAGPGAIQDAASVWFNLVLSGPANVGWFGAVADGEVGAGTDNSPFFTAALAASPSIYVPIGQTGGYRLATPVDISDGYAIFGEPNFRVYAQQAEPDIASVIYPDTCAFQSATPLVQLEVFTLNGICFEGGTTQVDVGLCHVVNVSDCVFRAFSVAGFCQVRGEKNSYTNLYFEWDADTPSTYGLGFGYDASVFYSGGLYAGQTPAVFFGSPGAFVDKVRMQNIFFQGYNGVGHEAAWTTAAFTSRNLSLATIDNMTWFGGGIGNDGICFNNLQQMQNCRISNLVPDTVNSTGSTADFLVSPLCVDTVFTNVSPAFAGNCNFTKSFNIAFYASTTLIACLATGDNVTKYGFYIGSGTDQTVTFIGCSTVIYSANASALIKGQITLVGCFFTTTNLPSGSNQFIDRRDSGMSFLTMVDSGGTAAATQPINFNWALAGGGENKSFYIGPKNPGCGAVAYADLPASPAAGMYAYIYDSNVNTFGATINSGGGTDKVFAWYNGADWTVVGV